MAPLIVVCGEDCAYCKKAKMLIGRALVNEPRFTPLDIVYVLEDSEAGKAYPHTLIPALFCGAALLFEGNPKMDDIVSAMNTCAASC